MSGMIDILRRVSGLLTGALRPCAPCTGLMLLMGLAGCLGSGPATVQASEVQHWTRPVPLRSGFDTMGPSTQAMQTQDANHPGWFALEDGAKLYQRVDGRAQRACTSCHGEASESFRTTAAVYPRFDQVSGHAIDLSGRIEACRLRYQQADPWPREDARRLSLHAHIAMQARGQPVQPDSDPRLQAARTQGHARFNQRIGQLSLSCADCHDRNWGQRLGGSPIPQGHPNAYPLWRLQWQALGSLQRRLRSCLTGVRAEPWPAEHPAWIELELFLQWRAAGLKVETPGVRP